MMFARPVTKTRGRKTTTFVRVEATTAVVTSAVPAMAASPGDMPASCLRKTTSSTTMELSTNMPTPRVSPARLMMLRSMPARSISRKVAITDTGIETATMATERRLRRKNSSTSTASRPPCHAASVRLEIDSRIDTLWSVAHLHVERGRQPGLELLHRLLDRVDDLHGVAALHLLHVDEHGVRARRRRRAGPHELLLWQGVERDLGHVAQADDRGPVRADHHRADVVERLELADGPQHHLPVGEADRAAREAHVVGREGLHHLEHGHPVRGEPVEVEPHRHRGARAAVHVGGRHALLPLDRGQHLSARRAGARRCRGRKPRR